MWHCRTQFFKSRKQMTSHMSAFISWPKRIYVLRSWTFTVFFGVFWVCEYWGQWHFWVGFQFSAIGAAGLGLWHLQKKRNVFLPTRKLKFSTNYDLFNTWVVRFNFWILLMYCSISYNLETITSFLTLNTWSRVKGIILRNFKGPVLILTTHGCWW